MNTILVGYDLNKAGKDYADLITSIKALGAWWHHLDSTWLIRTNENVTSARDKLAPYIDGDDQLLVLNVTDDAAAWIGFDSSGAKWLHDNL